MYSPDPANNTQKKCAGPIGHINATKNGQEREKQGENRNNHIMCLMERERVYGLIGEEMNE